MPFARGWHSVHRHRHTPCTMSLCVVSGCTCLARRTVCALAGWWWESEHGAGRRAPQRARAAPRAQLGVAGHGHSIRKRWAGTAMVACKRCVGKAAFVCKSWDGPAADPAWRCTLTLLWRLRHFWGHTACVPAPQHCSCCMSHACPGHKAMWGKHVDARVPCSFMYSAKGSRI